MRSAQLPEAINDILLPDFHGDAGPCSELFGNCAELGDNALVNLEELFGSGSVKPKHLHSAYFETFGENHIDDSACAALGDYMGFYDAARAVIEKRRALS